MMQIEYNFFYMCRFVNGTGLGGKMRLSDRADRANNGIENSFKKLISSMSYKIKPMLFVGEAAITPL